MKEKEIYVTKGVTLDSMYSNVSKKLKFCAKTIFFVNMLSFISIGVVFTFYALIMGFTGKSNMLLWAAVTPFASLWGILITYAVTCALYAFGELVERACGNKEKQNTDEAKASLADNSNAQSVRSKQDSDSEWYCPDCNRYHKSYIGTCGCGRQRPSAAAPKAPHPSKPAPQPKAEEVEKPAPTLKADEWYCPECGLVHKSYVGSCGCGRQKP